MTVHKTKSVLSLHKRLYEWYNGHRIYEWTHPVTHHHLYSVDSERTRYLSVIYARVHAKHKRKRTHAKTPSR